jgi:hypothetical protein
VREVELKWRDHWRCQPTNGTEQRIDSVDQLKDRCNCAGNIEDTCQGAKQIAEQVVGPGHRGDVKDYFVQIDDETEQVEVEWTEIEKKNAAARREIMIRAGELVG